MNIERLRLVQQKIKENPQEFGMNSFCFHIRNCGTVACIGGWAAFLALGLEHPTFDKRPAWYYASPKSLERIAQEYLELTDEETNQLFYFERGKFGDLWLDYNDDYYKSKVTPEQRAELGCELIEEFIKRNGDLSELVPYGN